MSNTLPSRRGRPPRTDAEWAREIQRRIESLESSTSVRIGPWVLNALGGDLIATTPDSKVVLSDPVLSSDTTATPSNSPASTNILDLLSQLTGLDFTGPLEFVNSLLDIIFGATDINLADPITIFNAIVHLIEQTMLNIEHVVQAIADALGFGGIVTGIEQLQQWISETFLGLISPDRLPMIPISHLFDGSVNMLRNPTFEDVPITDPTGTWYKDADVSHDLVGGSATTICGGSLHELYSVDLIPVAEGQSLRLSGHIKMANVVASGKNAVQIAVAAYKTSDASDIPVITPIGSITTYGTKDWQRLVDSYKVPAGVATIRVRAATLKEAKSGQVWIDDLELTREGLIQMHWVEDLFASLEEAWIRAIREFENFTGIIVTQGPVVLLQTLLDVLNPIKLVEHIWEALSDLLNPLLVARDDEIEQLRAQVEEQNDIIAAMEARLVARGI